MKKISPGAYIKYMGFFIFALTTYFGNAQPGSDANTHLRPYMYFPHDPQVLKNFVSIKLPLIDEETRKIQPRSFMLGNFLEMIEYFEKTYKQFKCMHIYFAAYSDEGSANVPRNCGNLLTLIFAPASTYSTPQTDLAYFIIPPDLSFDEDYVDEFKIDKKVYEEWTNNYVSKVMGAISGTFDRSDPDNQVDGTPSDTRCITYCKKDLLELVNEQTYTHYKGTDKVKFKKSMIASFAAFGATGNPEHHNDGKNRLFIQFDFLDDKGKIIHLEETFDARRTRKTESCEDCTRLKKKDEKSINGLDNGQLCPPCTNCPVGYAECEKKD